MLPAVSPPVLRDPTHELLEGLYQKFDFRFLSPDPLECVRGIGRKEDAESAAFIAAVFAYGRADLIVRNVNGLLGRMDFRPHEFLLNFEPRRGKSKFRSFRYRFNDTEDLVRLFTALREILRAYGSLETAFLRHHSPEHPNVGPALSGLIRDMLDSIGPRKPKKRASFDYLLPSPEGGSACKRLNLFLRWMVRKDSIDLGLWGGVGTNQLLLPIDTHVFRILTNLGLIDAKTVNWKLAVSATEKLKRFDPQDPVKYDFAICSYGKLGYCVRTPVPEKCGRCELRPICRLYAESP